MYVLVKERINEHVNIEKFPREYVYLATCHRQEIYTTEQFHLNGFRKLEGKKVVVHLLEVVSGLRSFIIGETEILRQVRDALVLAQSNNTINQTLYKLFKSASNFGAKVRTETKISAYKSSIVSLVFDYINKNKNQNIGVLGCGFLGKVILKNLARRRFTNVTCSSRDFESVKKFSENFGYTALPYNKKDDLFKNCDTVITALNQNIKIDTPVTNAFVIDLGNNIADFNSNIVRLSDIKKIEFEMKSKKKIEIEEVKKMIEIEVKDIFRYIVA